MKQIYILFLSIVFMSLNSIVNANPINKPEKCPSIESFQSVTWNIFQEVSSGSYAWIIGQEANKFDTPETWQLLVAFILAENKEKAVKEANQVIGTLIFKEGPYETLKSWTCKYVSKTDPKGAAAIVSTPKNA